MKLNDFLDKFDEYDIIINESFQNQWSCYRNRNGITYNFYFGGQPKEEASLSVTVVEGDEIVEGTILFKDVNVIFVHVGIVLLLLCRCNLLSTTYHTCMVQ